MQPISFPSRSRKPATETLALVTSGFWPLILAQAVDGRLQQGLVLGGLADAHVDDDLLELGDRHRVVEVELRGQRLGDRRSCTGRAGEPFPLSFNSRRACVRSAPSVAGVWARVESIDQAFFLETAGVGRLAWADVAQAGAARLAVALLLAVVGEPVADADARGCTWGRRACTFETSIGISLESRPPCWFFGAGLQVLVDPVDPLDDDLVLRRGGRGAPWRSGRSTGVPLSSPVITSTWSSLRMCMVCSLVESGRLVGDGRPARLRRPRRPG